VILRDLRDLAAELPGAHAQDPTARCDAVGVGDGGGRIQPALQLGDLGVEVGIQGQLPLDEQRRDEHDPRSTVRGETAREVESVLRLLPLEQRDDDAAVPDRLGAAGETPGAAPEAGQVGPSHRRSWYGTLARITCGSNRSSRLR